LRSETAIRRSDFPPFALPRAIVKGLILTVAILKKFQEAATAQKENFYVIFIPYTPHVENIFRTIIH